MAKHEIEVRLLVTGSQVKLYIVSNEELKELLLNSKSNGSLRYHEILSSEPHLIYSGIDPIDGDTSIEIFVDGEEILVDGCESVADDAEANESRSSQQNMIIINSENSRELNGLIPKEMHAFVIR